MSVLHSPGHPFGKGGQPSADLAGLLRRIERHVPFASSRVVLALVRLSRVHVVRASWVDPPYEIEQAIRAGRAEEGRPDRLRSLVQDALLPLADIDPEAEPEAHAVAMVRCRLGRVVWLPSDLAWLSALETEAEATGLPIVECFLVSEHGWRTRVASAAGPDPALAA